MFCFVKKKRKWEHLFKDTRFNHEGQLNAGNAAWARQGTQQASCFATQSGDKSDCGACVGLSAVHQQCFRARQLSLPYTQMIHKYVLTLFITNICHMTHLCQSWTWAAGTQRWRRQSTCVPCPGWSVPRKRGKGYHGGTEQGGVNCGYGMAMQSQNVGVVIYPVL